MELDSPLSLIRGVGPVLADKFLKLGITTAADLINDYPRRYDDYSNIMPIGHLKPGKVTVLGELKQVQGRYVRRGMHITEALVNDKSGSVRLVWFNQPYRANSLKTGEILYISGEYKLSRQRFAIYSPSVERSGDFTLNTARIVPIYKETAGLKSLQIRKVLSHLLSVIDQLPEVLPDWMVEKYKLMDYAQTMRNIHFPESSKQLELAKNRLGFDEIFVLILASLIAKTEIIKEKAPQVRFDENLAKQFVNRLPFQLTDAQRRISWQIYQDMQKIHPMNRLIEGDVGSGKTVVAVMAALMVINDGHQVAFMAPTEILARQHARSIHGLLKLVGKEAKAGLLVGSLSKQQKISARKAISDGTMQIIIGTQAIIQDAVDMSRLELIIIDEQHRFGVEQRKDLMKKAGHMPHVLSLSATPIPRSLALTIYGELEVSQLKEKPLGRKEVITKLVPPSSRHNVIEDTKTQLARGRQVFVVCPSIDESDVGELDSVKKIYHSYSTSEFKDWRVGILHGRMKSDEKNNIMKKFLEHDLDILVATTVIEVGVDVPNATVIFIHNPERFGLAQIHQLRGRVGRGQDQGYCYLFLEDSAAPSRRLRALEATQDGFELAELDLKIRGPGAIYGNYQHGRLDLRMADLANLNLIKSARQAAAEFHRLNPSFKNQRILRQQVLKTLTITSLN